MISRELGIPSQAQIQLWVFTMPPLKKSHGFVDGLYFCVTSDNADQEDDFQGAAIYESVDEWETFRSIGFIHEMDSMGYGRWEGDEAVIRTFGSQLYSAKPASVAAGVNRAMFGEELISFEGAAQTANTGEYRLTGISRGLRGTARSEAGSDVNLCFCMVSDFRGLWHELEADRTSSVREYKAARPRTNIMEAEPMRVILDELQPSDGGARVAGG